MSSKSRRPTTVPTSRRWPPTAACSRPSARWRSRSATARQFASSPRIPSSCRHCPKRRVLPVRAGDEVTWDSRSPVEPGYASGQPTQAIAAAESNSKDRVAQAVEQARAEILDLSHRIHAHPEPAFEEHQAAAWMAEAVARHGYQVDLPAGRLPTAVRARLPGGRGLDGPKIGILAEYDALPGLGHGCGHNSMAASGVGAAIALAAIADDLPGEIVFLGTPAEERGSGKQFMIEDGLFDGIDAALLYHPCDRSHVESHPLASEDVEVVFTGLQSHASSDPWLGRNALDAMVL